MANPRQRRKQRSSAASGSSHTSKRAQRKKLHRAPPLKGPAAAIVGDQWDRTKTARQNYAALGLVGDGLALRPSGGVERGVAEVLEKSGKGKGKGKAVDGGDDEPGATSASARPLRKGLGRIIRDEQGNVVDIIEGGADEEEEEGAGNSGKAASGGATPWGKPFKDWDRLEDPAAPVDEKQVHLPARVGPQTEAGQKIIASFEQRAATAAPVHRHTSALEADWLRDLVRAHGDDTEAMARDAKRNIWQKTEGEIKRAIKKAGGKEALLA